MTARLRPAPRIGLCHRFPQPAHTEGGLNVSGLEQRDHHADLLERFLGDEARCPAAAHHQVFRQAAGGAADLALRRGGLALQG